MKATFDIPDDLYRQVKARSALEGRPLRSVAVELFQRWLSPPHLPEPTPAPAGTDDHPATRFDTASWHAIAQKYIRPGMSHDWADIKESIARGGGEEAAQKLRASEERP